MKNGTLKAIVYEKVECLFRAYDLKPTNHEEQCKLLAEWVLKDIEEHPCCEEILNTWNSTKFYLLQIALENIKK